MSHGVLQTFQVVSGTFPGISGSLGSFRGGSPRDLMECFRGVARRFQDVSGGLKGVLEELPGPSRSLGMPKGRFRGFRESPDRSSVSLDFKGCRVSWMFQEV